MYSTSKTTLELDMDLVNEAMELSGENTIKATVCAALEEYVRIRRINEFMALEGKFDYDPDYNYKEERQKW